MNTYNLGFIGFGNVGCIARLLAAKATELRDVYDIECRITERFAQPWLALPLTG